MTLKTDLVSIGPPRKRAKRTTAKQVNYFEQTGASSLNAGNSLENAIGSVRRPNAVSLDQAFDVETWLSFFQHFFNRDEVNNLKQGAKNGLYKALYAMAEQVPTEDRTCELRLLVNTLYREGAAQIDDFDVDAHMEASEEEEAEERERLGSLFDGEDSYGEE